MRKYVTIDEYLVDLNRPLGEGASGKVFIGYPARGREDDRMTLFAVKCIPLSSKEEVTESIVQEISLLRRLKHPNIVEFIDAKKTKDSIYLVLEYCGEGSLDDLVQAGAVPQPQTVDFFKQLLSAGLHISTLGIIHRDIKPKNLLLSKGALKLADFGLAKRAQSEVEFQGTLEFMSPQILRGESYTSKSDVWAAGVTLFFLLNRRLPWTENVHSDMLREQAKGVGPLLDEKTHPLLKSLLQGMLAFEQERRLSWADIADHPAMSLTKAKLQVLPPSCDCQIGIRETFIDTRLDEENQLQRESMGLEYDQQKQILRKGKAALQALQRYMGAGKFLSQLRHELIKVSSHVSLPLLIKAQFLLAKRALVISKDVFNMLSFSIHSHGAFSVSKDEFQALLSPLMELSLCSLRGKAQKVYHQNKIAWGEACEMLFTALRHMEGFTLNHAAQTYTEKAILSREFAKTWGSVLQELFLEMSLPLVELAQREGFRKLKKSRVVLETGFGAGLVYDLLAALQFEKAVFRGEDMDTYSRFSSSMEIGELFYRVKLARQHLQARD